MGTFQVTMKKGAYIRPNTKPGDTFIFAGQVWALAGVTNLDVLVRPANHKDPKMPSWGGSKFALSTYLAKRVRQLMFDESHWGVLPTDVREWLELQRDRSRIVREDEMLLETFPKGKRNFLVVYPFEGRLAHTTLAMLLTRRLERLGVGPLGFVCNDYAMAIWALEPMDGLDFDALFDQDMLGDDLEAWLSESFMMKRAFKGCAIIAGLIAATAKVHRLTLVTRTIPDISRTGVSTVNPFDPA